MFKKHYWILFSSIVVFAGLIAAAIALQSELFLYAASGIPIVIFYVLPDIKQNQFIRSDKDRDKFKLIQQTGSGEPLMILSFEPDFVRWECSKLYFHLNDIITDVPAASASSTDTEASVSVLAFDLSPHPKKTGWVGIDLEQLTQRLANLSYTTDEVTRFVMQVQDLEDIALQMMGSTTTASLAKNKSKSKSISA